MSTACITTAAPSPELEWPSRLSPDAFEFRLDDPVAMQPADELFSGGRLVPLHLPPPQAASEPAAALSPPSEQESVVVTASPKAPKCSSRWRELLGLKNKASGSGTTATRYTNPNPRSLKHFLRRNPNSGTVDSSMSLSLLRDSDTETISLSSRRSLSSSSSSSSGEDLPRLSLDNDKPNQIPISLNRNPHPPRVRVSRPRSGTPERRATTASASTRSCTVPAAGAAVPPPAGDGTRGVTVDSPRMNASGRVVFQGLDRSSSSPGSFNGGPRVRNWAMERSYSAGVRVTPVLNVPAFGLGNLFRKEKEAAPSPARGGAGGSSSVGGSKGKGEKKLVDSSN